MLQILPGYAAGTPSRSRWSDPDAARLFEAIQADQDRPGHQPPQHPLYGPSMPKRETHEPPQHGVLIAPYTLAET
jgi:hypothetical protein